MLISEAASRHVSADDVEGSLTGQDCQCNGGVGNPLMEEYYGCIMCCMCKSKIRIHDTVGVKN